MKRTTTMRIGFVAMVLYGFVLTVSLNAADSEWQIRRVNQEQVYSDNGEVWSAPDRLVYASMRFYSKAHGLTGAWRGVYSWLRLHLSQFRLYINKTLAIGKGAGSRSGEINDQGGAFLLQYPAEGSEGYVPKPRARPLWDHDWEIKAK